MPILPAPVDPRPVIRPLVPAGQQPITEAKYIRVEAGIPGYLGEGYDVTSWLSLLATRTSSPWIARNFHPGEFTTHNSHAYYTAVGVTLQRDDEGEYVDTFEPGTETGETVWNRLSNLTSQEIATIAHSFLLQTIAVWALTGNSAELPPDKLPLATSSNKGALSVANFNKLNAVSGSIEELIATWARASATDRTAGIGIARLLEELTGDDRYSYNSLRDKPSTDSAVDATRVQQIVRNEVEQRSLNVIPAADQTAALWGLLQGTVPHVERLGTALRDTEDHASGNARGRTSYSYFRSNFDTSRISAGDRISAVACPHESDGEISPNFQKEIEEGHIWFKWPALNTIAENIVDTVQNGNEGIAGIAGKWIPVSGAISDVPHANTGDLNVREPPRMILIGRRADNGLVIRREGANGTQTGTVDLVLYRRRGW